MPQDSALFQAAIAACLPVYEAHRKSEWPDRRWSTEIDSPAVHIALVVWDVAGRWYRSPEEKRKHVGVRLYALLRRHKGKAFHQTVHDYLRKVARHSALVRLNDGVHPPGPWYYIATPADAEEFLTAAKQDPLIIQFLEEVKAEYCRILDAPDLMDAVRQDWLRYRAHAA